MAGPGSLPAPASAAPPGVLGPSPGPGPLLLPAHRHLCVLQQSLHLAGTERKHTEHNDN